MASDWYCAADLKGLPGLPKSDRNIRLRASKDNWLSQKRSFGKGLEFHISSLPQKTQQYLAKKAAESIVKSIKAPVRSALELTVKMDRQETVMNQKIEQAREIGLAQFNGLSEIKQNRAQAKLLVLESYAAYIQPYIEINKETIGLNKFVEEFNARELEFSDWIYTSVKKLSYAFK